MPPPLSSTSEAQRRRTMTGRCARYHCVHRSLVVRTAIACAWLFVQTLVSAREFDASRACKLHELPCDNGKCISLNRYCDGSDDCGDASDEPVACSNCNRTYYGQKGTKYALRMSEPFQRHLSFVCRMEFVAAGGEFGELIEITFLSFQVGFYHLASNSSPSCLQGHMQLAEEDEANALAERNAAQPLRLVNERPHHRSHHRATARIAGANTAPPSAQASPQPSSVPAPAVYGGFCGNLVGRSATFYSSRRSVSLTVTFPVTSTVSMATAGVFLTYRYLKRADIRRDGFYYGDDVPGTHCDRVLTDCHERKCRVRSPNYPGFYPRNTTCSYHVRQAQVPAGRVAQVVFQQRNEYKISVHTGLPNAGGVLYNALTSECAADVVEISDGAPENNPDSVVLMRFCGSGQLPKVVSSGPDATVRIISVPYQQLLDSRVEIDVSVQFVDPTELKMTGRLCNFVLDSSEGRSGTVYTPRHTIPDNTACTFQFQGRSRFDRVWLYFTSYFVPDKQPWSGLEKCDVSQLEVYDSPVFDGDSGSAFFGQIGQDRGRGQDNNDTSQSFPARLIGRYCEKSTPRMCSHANDYPGLLPPRPCHVPSESYLSSSAKMALRYRVFANPDVALKTGSFVARYEFVDTSQNGAPADNSRCYRVFRSRSKSRGRIASPRNTFFYGRGGQQDLQCTYRFQGTSSQRVRLRFDKVHLVSEGCSTVYDPNLLRYGCRYIDQKFGSPFVSIGKQRYAEIRMTEYWLALTIQMGCICSNSSVLQSPLEITSIGSEVLLTFAIKGMTVREDFTNFGFEGNYEFLPPADCGGDTGLLRGNVGEADLSPNAHPDDDGSPMNPGVGAYRSGAFRRCRWLLEASPDKFLYLKVAGGKRQVQECGDSRLLVHSGDEFEQTIIICAYPDVGVATEQNQVSVDIFSPSWSNGTPSRKKASTSVQPERLMLETVCTGSSPSFKIRWMEVTRPFKTTSAGQSLRNVDCLYECPELDACISPELWCDGAKHCPSGYDEVPENCSRFPTVPVVLGCVGAVVVFLVALGALVLMRRSCQFRKYKESSSSRPPGCEDVPMENI